MPNFVNQRQPVHYSSNIPSCNTPVSNLLDLLAQTAVRIKGTGHTTELRETLIQCLSLCPLHPRKEGTAQESYQAGVHAFKCALKRSEIENLDGYHDKSWCEGYDDAAVAASKALNEMTKN